MKRFMILLLLGLITFPLGGADMSRADRAQQFHRRAQEGTGVLVPFYVYPVDLDHNPHYNQLIKYRRSYETVPFWVIINPASGPGKEADANYTQAIDRLIGAGCVVLGYIPTGHSKRPAAEVRQDIQHWADLYPRVHGIFFDEMGTTDTAAAVSAQSELTRQARTQGFWPIVANPGTDAPIRYFAAEAADVFVIHEGERWPTEEKLKRYANYPPFTRAILVHSQTKLDASALKLARENSRWLYVTEAIFRPNDAKAANPWDRLSAHLGELCGKLAGN